MVKHIALGLRIFVLLVLLALAYLTLWLQGGTRDMNWAKPWLLEALNPPDAPFVVTIDNVSLNWQNITQFGDVKVSDLSMQRRDGGIFASIHDVNITLDPIGFLPHRRIIHGLSIDRPHLYLTRDGQGVLRLGLEGTPETLAVEQLTGFFASDDASTETTRQRVPFRELAITNASLLFTDTASGAVLKSDAFSFRIGRDGTDLSGSLSMPFTFRDRPGHVDAGVVTHTLNRTRVLNARVDQLPSELICLLAPCPPDIAFDGAVSGKITLQKQPRQPIDSGTVALASEQAVITAPGIFPEPLQLKKLSIIASGEDNFTAIHLSSLTLDLADTKINAAATVQKRDDGWYARGEAGCSKLKIAKLYKYWPLTLSPDSREWVTTQLSKGYAQRGTVAFDLTPADMGDAPLRDAAINATVIARNLTVDYIPGFPVITEANGTAKFSGKKIAIDIESGKLLDATTLKPSTLAFTNLDIPATPMETTLNLTASAANVATMLKLPPFTFDDAVNLDPATITGTADATIKLAFDAFSGDAEGGNGEVDFSAIDYDVDATLDNISQPKLVGGRDVSGFSGTVKANAQGAELAGSVKVDGSNVNLTLKDGPAASDTTVAATGTLATTQFEKFGIPSIEQIGSGSVGLDVALKLGKDTQTLTRGVIDLTNVPVTLKEISWSKPAGSATSLEVTPGNVPNQYGVKLTAPGLSVGDARVTFTPAMDDVVALKLPAVKTATNDFALDYARKPGGYAIAVKGRALDISDSYDDDSTGNALPPAQKDLEKLAEKPLENSILADFPAMDLTIDLEKFVMVKQYPFTNLNGTLRCDAVRCSSARFTGNTGDGALKATIGSANGARQLVVTHSNAGAFLRALDISDRLYGGTLNFDGSYDDTKTPAPLLGRLQIQQFKLKNSEILARIISIGSLSGLANVLTGQGIDFAHFKATIGALAGVINVTQGSAQSNALGITVEGSVDTNASGLDLKGLVVPANSLNSILSNIPIIGDIAGGKGGLIAFNYSVKGPMADPAVFVNPLSGLTPGFLRGIFTAGDKKVQAVPQSASEKPTVPAEEVPATPVPWPSEKGRR